MRAPDDLPRRPRAAGAQPPGSHDTDRGGRRRRRAADLAARHRPLLHRLPLVRLARASRGSGAACWAPRSCSPCCSSPSSSCWRGRTCSSPTASPRPSGSPGPEDELLERYHDLVSERAGWVRIVVAGLLALIAGSGVSAEWNSWILFTNGGDFGIDDPQFGRDVGFYVFKLPFLSFVVDWLFASLLIVLIVTIVAHYLNGGIRVQPPSPRVTPQVKAHLSVLLAALAHRQGGRLLAAALRADGVEPGRRRRRHVHRRQRPAPGAQPAGADLGGGRDPVRRQHLPPGLGPAGPGGRPVGVRGRGGRRHLPADRAELPGAAERVGQGARRTSSATSSPRSTPST